LILCKKNQTKANLQDTQHSPKAEAFRTHQLAVSEQLKGQLWTHWLPKCADVFSHNPPIPINDDAAAYFRCVLFVLPVGGALLQGESAHKQATTPGVGNANAT